MKKFLNLFDKYALKILVGFLILFVALYPKLPSIHIIRTWVYIRLEDFFILATVIVWGVQLLRKKVSIPVWLGGSIGAYWLVGLISLIFSMLFIGPHLANYFPHIAILQYLRRIEYMILFFVAFSTVKSAKDVRDYFVILALTVFGVVFYGFGQRYYIDLWDAFPHFFEKFAFCFPSFQTGNEEFAKGIPLCLKEGGRLTSTFGGHYDLAAYLVLVLPIFLGVFVSLKKGFLKISSLLIFLIALILLLLTASRTSFVAYLIGAIAALVFYKKKVYILPLCILSVVLLLVFSGSTARRLMETFRLKTIITNSVGQEVKISKLPPSLRNKLEEEPVSVDYGSISVALPEKVVPTEAVARALTAEEERKIRLENPDLKIATFSGDLFVRTALVYDISFTTRLQAEWPNAWNALIRNPLLGSGYSTITLATDNDYLRALGETGFLGLMSFIFIFIILGITLAEFAPVTESKMVKGFSFGLAGGFVGLALNGILIDVFEASKVAESMWLLMGISAGGLFVYKNKKSAYTERFKKVILSGIIPYIFLVSVVTLSFLGSVKNFFAANDFSVLRWAAGSTFPEAIRLFTQSQGMFYRPLSNIVIFFMYNMFSFQPQNYHTFLFILHAFAVIAVYLIAMKLLKNRLLGFLTAIVFLFAPGHGENLYWLSSLPATLSTVFILYALNSFINFRNKKSIAGYIASIILTGLALLSYEMALIAPLLFGVVDLFIFKPRRDRLVLTYLPFAALIGAYFGVRQTFLWGGDYRYSLIHFIPNVVGNAFGYLGLFFGGLNFLPLYDLLRETFRGNILLFIVVILTAAAVLFLLRRKYKAEIRKELKKFQTGQILFGLIFAGAALMPFLGLGNISERYLYLASFGISLSLVVLMNDIVSRFSNKNSNKRTWILVLSVTVLALVFHLQNNIQGKSWKRAGEITRTTLAIFRVDHENLSKNSNVYFVNTPVRQGGAWVFPGGAGDGLWFIYRDNLPRISNVGSIDDAKKAISENKTSNNYIFEFDGKGEPVLKYKDEN